MTIVSPYQYFSTNELMCHGIDCGCDHGLHMDDDFMRIMIAMRSDLNFPFYVSSAYRCPVHNSRISTTGTAGPHTLGRAMDVFVYGQRAFALIECAMRFPIFGIGVMQHGPHAQRYIHLDNLTNMTRPYVWSY